MKALILDHCFVFKHVKASGVPDERLAIMIGYYRAARASEFAQIDPTLARLIGRARS